MQRAQRTVEAHAHVMAQRLLIKDDYIQQTQEHIAVLEQKLHIAEVGGAIG